MSIVDIIYWICSAERSELKMLNAWQCLGEEIGDVAFPSHVHDAKLPLADAVLKPVKPHVDTFRQFGNHDALCQANGALIIT